MPNRKRKHSPAPSSSLPVSEIDVDMEDVDTIIDPVGLSPISRTSSLTPPPSSNPSSEDEDDSPLPKRYQRSRRALPSDVEDSDDDDNGRAADGVGAGAQEEEEDDEGEGVDEATLERYRNRIMPDSAADGDEEALMGGGREKGKGKAKSAESGKHPAKKATPKKKAPSTPVSGKKKKGKAKETEPPPDDSDSDISIISEATPSASGRMTARQRALATGADDDLLLELQTERPSKKKNLTTQELALRKSETARRRKNRAHQKAEDEQNATIQKLLKKQAAKKRTKEVDVQEEEPKLPTAIRYIQRGDSSTLSFPASLESCLTSCKPSPSVF